MNQLSRQAHLNEPEQRRIMMMRLGVTQAVLARRLRVTPSFLNQWLQGKRNSQRLQRGLEKLYHRKLQMEQKIGSALKTKQTHA